MATEHENVIPKLKVTLAHQRGSSPPTLIATVTNENSTPVSILSYNSPLDGLALQVGLLSITPSGADEPLHFPQLEVARIWPPSAKEIVTIAPGEGAENEIVLKPQIIPPESLPKQATYELKGEWQAVWAMSKEEISQVELENAPASKGSFSGKFSSGTVVIEI